MSCAYDNNSNIKQVLGLKNTTIATATTTYSAWIDTNGFESLDFLCQCSNFDDGSLALSLQDADESDKSDADAVSSDFVINPDTPLAPSAAEGAEDVLGKIGYVGNKRYVRLAVVSTAGDADVDVDLAVQVIQSAAKSKPIS